MEQIFIFLSRFEHIQLRYFHSQGEHVEEMLKLRKSIIQITNDGLQDIQSQTKQRVQALLSQIHKLVTQLLNVAGESLKQQIEFSIEPLGSTFVNPLEHSQVAQQILAQTQPGQVDAPRLHRSKASLKSQYQKQANEQASNKTNKSQLSIQQDKNVAKIVKIKGHPDITYQAPNTTKSNTSYVHSTSSLKRNQSFDETRKEEQQTQNTYTAYSRNKNTDITQSQINDHFYQQENTYIQSSQIKYLQIEMTQEQQLQLVQLVNEQNKTLKKQNQEITKLRSQNETLLLQLQQYKHYFAKYGIDPQINDQKMNWQ